MALLERFKKVDSGIKAFQEDRAGKVFDVKVLEEGKNPGFEGAAKDIGEMTWLVWSKHTITVKDQIRLVARDELYSILNVQPAKEPYSFKKPDGQEVMVYLDKVTVKKIS